MVETDIDGATLDSANKIVTAPAYMKGTASPDQIYENVKKMVDTVAQEIRASSSTLPFTVLVHVEVDPKYMTEFLAAMQNNAEKSR